MTNVDVRSRWVQPEFDSQWFARGLGAGQLFHPVFLRNQLLAPTQGNSERLLDTICYRKLGI